MKNNVKSVETKKPSPIKRKVKAIAAAGALGVATIFGANACKQVVHDIEYKPLVPDDVNKIIKIDDGITDPITRDWISDVGKSLIYNNATNGGLAVKIRYYCYAPIKVSQVDTSTFDNDCIAHPTGVIQIDDVIDEEVTFKLRFNDAIVAYIGLNTL